jgi:hypothetical protein
MPKMSRYWLAHHSLLCDYGLSFWTSCGVGHFPSALRKIEAYLDEALKEIIRRGLSSDPRRLSIFSIKEFLFAFILLVVALPCVIYD